MPYGSCQAGAFPNGSARFRRTSRSALGARSAEAVEFGPGEKTAPEKRRQPAGGTCQAFLDPREHSRVTGPGRRVRALAECTQYAELCNFWMGRWGARRPGDLMA